jgi:hypothetical protein
VLTSSLTKQLRNFSHTIRQLGSSIGVLSAAFAIRAHTSTLLDIFRKNAQVTIYSTGIRKGRANGASASELEGLSFCFKELGSSVSKFLTYINGFSEFENGLTFSRAFELDCQVHFLLFIYTSS